MRADRLLSIMLLLQVDRLVTVRELAERLEVSERTIYRDMEALSTAGIPVVAERGVNGGWSLLEEYRTNLTGLKPSEIQALLSTKSPHLLADLGLDKIAEAAFIKLLAALPAAQRRDAEFARQRLFIDVTGWRETGEAVPFLPSLQAAIWQEKKVQLSYRRGDETTVERLVDPLGLVAKGSVWYLVAAVEGEIRTYRVSRVLAVQETAQPSQRPQSFDLAAYWAQSAADFKAGLPRYLATIRVAPDVLSWLNGPGGRRARIEPREPRELPDAAGWTSLTLRFDVIEEACQFALSFGPQLEVLAPPDLRAMVIDQANRTVAFYMQQA